MKKISGVTGVMIQEMLSGTELFIGAKYKPRFGQYNSMRMGGIFVEVLGDVSPA
jgi:acetyltransferase